MLSVTRKKVLDAARDLDGCERVSLGEHVACNCMSVLERARQLDRFYRVLLGGAHTGFSVDWCLIV